MKTKKVKKVKEPFVLTITGQLKLDNSFSVLLSYGEELYMQKEHLLETLKKVTKKSKREAIIEFKNKNIEKIFNAA